MHSVGVAVGEGQTWSDTVDTSQMGQWPEETHDSGQMQDLLYDKEYLDWM